MSTVFGQHARMPDEATRLTLGIRRCRQTASMPTTAATNAIGAAARREVAAKYSWENVAGKFEEILEWVAWYRKQERAAPKLNGSLRVSA